MSVVLKVPLPQMTDDDDGLEDENDRIAREGIEHALLALGNGAEASEMDMSMYTQLLGLLLSTGCPAPLMRDMFEAAVAVCRTSEPVTGESN